MEENTEKVRSLVLNFWPKFFSSSWESVNAFPTQYAPRSRLNILQALARVSWGQSRETLLTIFKALIKPLIPYGASVWYPNTSPSTIQPLQAVQNAALCISSGAVLMTSEDHLHSEAEVLPVR